MNERILIVDDSMYLRTILKDILNDAGYDQIFEAESGKEALELVREKKPSLVTLDLILPDNTGLDVMKKIKDIDPAISVIIVSAVGQDKIVAEAIDTGATAYIVKPFEEHKVLDVIHQVLDHHPS